MVALRKESAIVEQDRLMEEYEKFEELEEQARRRSDFKLAAKYQAILESLEPHIWHWMTQEQEVR